MVSECAYFLIPVGLVALRNRH